MDNNSTDNNNMANNSIALLDDNAELLRLYGQIRFPLDRYDQSLHESGYHPMPLALAGNLADSLLLLAAIIYRYTLQPCFALQSHVIDIRQGQIRKRTIACQLSQLSVKAGIDAFNHLLEGAPENITPLAHSSTAYDSDEGLKLLLSESNFALADHCFSFLQFILPQHRHVLSADAYASTISEYLQASGCDMPFFLLAMADGDQCSYALAVNRRHFSLSSAKRLASHFQRLASAMGAANKGDTISTLPMLAPEEIEQQIQACASEPMAFSAQKIYEYIEHYSIRSPDAPAVECGSQALTYSELNNSANQLANYLLSQGVQPHSPIAVLMEPDVNIIVSLLAIHKLACIYVPIDPSFPAERIAVILAEVLPQKILVCGPVDRHIKGLSEQIIDLDVLAPELANVSPSKPAIFVNGDDASHIFFTSGTTGKPKGVVATHNNLIHYMLSAKHEYRFNKADRFIAVARFTFSISLFELLSPLVVGARLRILHRDDVLHLEKLVEHFQWATVFHIGPSLLKKVLPYIVSHYTHFDAFQHMRHVSSGGDMVPPEVLELLKKIFVNADVYVIYGASEISCMGCCYRVPRHIELDKTLVGKPHANVKVTLVDSAGMPIPVGATGDILFAGSGLVQGYLNLQQLTAEKFIEIDGERFYRIGDVGRFDGEGNLEILGRQDYQVQVKGMRIELGELDYYLRQIPAVADAVAGVSFMEDENILVAYLVAQPGQTLELKAMRQFLLNKLPDYMLPTKYVLLDALPLNHNMKIDRKRLPTPDLSNSLLSAECVDPRHDIDRQLIDMWQGLFNSKGVGIEHDFFEMGGDSLLAVKFLAMVDQVFGRFIPISFLLKNSTLALIADAIATDVHEDGLGDVVVLKEGDPQLPPLFCFYGVLHYKALAEALKTKRMVCGVYLEEEVNLLKQGEGSQAFKAFSDVYAIADKYLARIKQFQAQGPYYIAGHSFGGIIGLEVARKLMEAGESVGLLAMLESWHPLIKKELRYSDKVYAHLKSFVRSPWNYVLKKPRRMIKQLCYRFNKQDNADMGVDHRAMARQQAIQRYRSKRYPGKVMIYRAADKNPFEPDHPSLGWQALIPDLTVVDIPGDHLGILKQPNADILAGYISEHLS